MLEHAPREAVVFVALVGLSTLALLALSDIFLTASKRASVGEWVTLWAKRYPMFALALTLVTGALLGHFFFATNP
jgi:hypothetical protein